MQDILDFIQDLGYKPKQAQIRLSLYTLGSSPASSIARQAQTERVYTYKTLQHMAEQGLVAQTKKSGTIHFRIPSEQVLYTYIQKRRDQRENRATQYAYIQSQLQELRGDHASPTPKIQLYEGATQVNNLFVDIQHQIVNQGLLSIAVFGTHTFQEQIVSDRTVSIYADSLMNFLAEKHIGVQNYIAEGGLIMEHIRQYPGAEKFGDLPAGDNAINIFVIGSQVYVVIYKGSPIGLKISSPEFARALHFLLKQTG